MGRKLLVVDDEPHVCILVRDLLRGSGYDCSIASDFEGAVRIAARPGARFDLLLTDILLPPFHGRDLANRIVGMHPGIKVLFMSGHPPRMLRDHGLLPAKAPFLMKPFASSHLLQGLADAAAATPSWAELMAPPREDA